MNKCISIMLVISLIFCTTSILAADDENNSSCKNAKIFGIVALVTACVGLLGIVGLPEGAKETGDEYSTGSGQSTENFMRGLGVVAFGVSIGFGAAFITNKVKCKRALTSKSKG